MYQGDDDNNSENSLDSLSDLSANSKRYDGIVLLLVITYRNDYPVYYSYYSSSLFIFIVFYA